MLCKQSWDQNELLSNGFLRDFMTLKDILIPMDIIKELIEFFISYDVHSFNDEGNHWMIPLEDIFDNIPKYCEIIKSLDRKKNTGKIKVKGEIVEFSEAKTYAINTNKLKL